MNPYQIPPPVGWTPPVEPVQQPGASQDFSEKVIPPPIGSSAVNMIASQGMTPAVGAAPGGLMGPVIPPPIGGPPASASLGPYGNHGQYRYGDYPPPIGSTPLTNPTPPPIGADPEVLLSSQPVPPPIGSEAANLLGQAVPPPKGWAPSTQPNQQMVPPPIGGPPSR